MWAVKSVIFLPSEAHRNPLPLNWPLLLPFSLALLFLDAGLPPPVCEPPCIMSWPGSANPTPAKKDQKGNIGVALQKKSHMNNTKRGRVNLPLLTAPVPPAQVVQGNPPPGSSSAKC